MNIEAGVVHQNQYMVSLASSLEGIDEAVNALMREGWVPQGGIAMMMRRDIDSDGSWYTPSYAQAMVRR